MNMVKNARIRKTLLFFEDRKEFMRLLQKDIEALIRKCNREDKIPTVRLNGTSDICWERVKDFDLFQKFEDVQFYDYTKYPDRTGLPDNYHLTFSLSETNKKEAMNVPYNIAAVFRNELPKAFMGRKVINGDEHDLRFLDPDNCVVGLKAKGSAKNDKTGFVQDA